jgi:acetolactate synthase-1/2/3 large subunit
MTSSQPVEGGELVARTLRQAGVSTVFALHGGHLESFYRGCLANDLELVDFRHEASAGHAAEAYARVTGEVGVCAITAGPGFANALPAILNAQVDGTPTVFLIGAPPLRERETNELQGGFDQLAIARPAAKWVVSITNVERIPALLAAAIRRARTGRRGPVVVELPIDILHASAPTDRVKAPTGLAVQPRPAPSVEEIGQVRDLLLAAQRPVVVVGAHARFSDLDGAVVRFAERAEIPVFASKRGLGIVPAGHPSDGHDASNLAALAKHGVDRPDLVILAGTREGLFLGGAGDGVIPEGVRLVQVFGDADELGRLRDIDVPVVAEVGSFFDALTRELEDDELPSWQPWRDAATAVQHKKVDDYPDVESADGLHPFHVAAEVAEMAGNGAVFAVDGGEAGQWAVQHTRTDGPGRVITTGYFGGLGVGPGYAIGAQIAAPERRVVLFSGDGSFGFHLQELDIMVHRNLPIVTVVLNNNIWGMSLHGQQIMYGQDYSAISRLDGRDYAAIARAFGAHAERVEKHADLGPALERAFDAGRPAVVEVMTDPAVVSPGLVQMLGDVASDTPQIVVPYYENIPL